MSTNSAPNVQNEKKSCRKNPDRIVSEREILYYRSRKLGTNRYLQQKIYKKNFFFHQAANV